MSRPLLLDLFCGAGGAAMGYHRAGFDVIGIDINPQPHYPFPMIEGDALRFRSLGLKVDAIHASPPCQLYSASTAMHDRSEYPDLVEPIRMLLQSTRVPWVIENVEGAPLQNPMTLCGSMFGMPRLRRHRLFQTNFDIDPPSPCRHHEQRDVLSVSGHGEGGSHRNGTKRGLYWGQDERRKAMGIDWMNRTELAQSIPPAYTEYIGRRMWNVVSPAAVIPEDLVFPSCRKGALK